MKFPGRLALQQRVIPAYRALFFEMLAQSCQKGLSLFAGQPLPIESISTAKRFDALDYVKAQNRHVRDPQSSLYLCWQSDILDWLEQQKPDALIVEANPRYVSNRRAISWMKQHGRPVLGWGLGAPRGGNLIEQYFRLNYLRTLDGVIAYSKRGADAYRSLGLNAVFVAYNAVSPKPRQAPPKKVLPPESPPEVLFVGRLQERKRIDILLHACASLPADIQPHLTIVGDGPAISYFQGLAAEIYPSAEIVGAKHGADLDDYFVSADLFALPGTGGLAVQQAMTHALPIIVAQGDGTQDDLVRPENGWQVPSGNQPAFTNALHNSLSDIPRLRKMGIESYRIVSEEINLEAMVEAFVTALNSVKKQT